MLIQQTKDNKILTATNLQNHKTNKNKERRKTFQIITITNNKRQQIRETNRECKMKQKWKSKQNELNGKHTIQVEFQWKFG